MIKETSKYSVENENGETIKNGFHDIMDATEFATNALLTDKRFKKAIIKGTITLEIKY